MYHNLTDYKIRSTVQNTTALTPFLKQWCLNIQIFLDLIHKCILLSMHGISVQLYFCLGYIKSSFIILYPNNSKINYPYAYLLNWSFYISKLVLLCLCLNKSLLLSQDMRKFTLIYCCLPLATLYPSAYRGSSQVCHTVLFVSFFSP